MTDSLGGVLDLNNVSESEVSSVDVAGGCRNWLRAGVATLRRVEVGSWSAV